MGLIPNLPLLIVVTWSYQRDPNRGIVWAWIGGLAMDLAMGAPLGISPVALMIAALVAGMGHRRLYRGNLVLATAILALAMVMYQLTYLVLLAAIGRLPLVLTIRQVALPLLLLHIVLLPVAYLGTAGLWYLVGIPAHRRNES